MADSNEVIPSYQRMPEDCELYSCDTILDLVKQLKRETKGRSTSCSLCVCYHDVSSPCLELPNRQGHISLLFMSQMCLTSRELVSAGAVTKPSELHCACAGLLIFSSALVLSCAPTRPRSHGLWVIGLHWTCFPLPLHSLLERHYYFGAIIKILLWKFHTIVFTVVASFNADPCPSSHPCPWCAPHALRFWHSLHYHH